MNGKQSADQYVSGQAGHPALGHRALQIGAVVSRPSVDHDDDDDDGQQQDDERRRRRTPSRM